jgi:hypothetical protein
MLCDSQITGTKLELKPLKDLEGLGGFLNQAGPPSLRIIENDTNRGAGMGAKD